MTVAIGAAAVVATLVFIAAAAAGRGVAVEFIEMNRRVPSETSA